MAYGLTQSANLVAASTQFFTAADSASLGITGSITVEGWVKISSLTTNGVVASKVFGSLNLGGWLLVILTTGHLEFQVSDGVNTRGDVTGNSALSTGVWTHIAGTWTVGSGNRPHVWINGIDDGDNGSSTTGATAILNVAHPAYIGAQDNVGTATNLFDGRTSLFRVWSIDNGSNIAGNMCKVLGTTTNLAAEWTLNNTLNDNSGNTNTLTNNGSATFGVDVPGTCTLSPINFLSMLGVGT